ncbi:MAG: BrnT family toxin [Lachnospiraceae bacterium]|nr:BrnT family toxin [Lachnospiraceae bacterium]
MYDTIGLVHDVLFVVYCDRDNKRTGDVDIRMISARRATKYEIEAYNNNVSGRR